MANILAEICEYKRDVVQKARRERSEDALLKDAKHMAAPRGFCDAMKRKTDTQQAALIAEIKKASPSKGLIRPDFEPRAIAEIYEQSGATCLSVLTDERYFQGHNDYIAQVKTAASLPVLRKDFMLEPYQIAESRAINADAVLLIMAALSNAQAAELFAAAKELGMNVLVEVHNKEELDRALSLPLEMLGVNNRNLKTLEVNLQTSHDLAPYIPETAIKIAESGIKSAMHIEQLQKTGIYAYLVGESLMLQKDIGEAVKRLLGQ